MGAKLRVVVCLVELSVFLLYFFWGIFPSLLNIMKRSSPASFEKKKELEKNGLVTSCTKIALRLDYAKFASKEKRYSGNHNCCMYWPYNLINNIQK